jgi:radical SAM superfamily enzyme YgiQ (UPF0313 family)
MKNIYLVHLAANDLGVRRLVMPLGPLMVASAIRKSPSFVPGDRVYICDSFREVLAQARRHRKDRVHFLASSMQLIRGVDRATNEAVRCAEIIKRRQPAVITCVGGPDVVLNRDDYLSRFDFVFEGEIGTSDPVALIRSGASFHRAATPADLGEEPLDYGLLAGRRYLAGSLQTARGCPFGCGFCNIGHIYGTRVRTIDAGRLEERLESLAAVHRGFVILGDDNFGGGLEAKVAEFLETIIRFQERRRFPFVFGIQTSLRTARSPDILKMMREALVIAAFLGVESPCEPALTAAGKTGNLGPPLADQVEAFTRQGIAPYISVILGLDEEAADVGARLRELFDACRSPYLQLNLINPVVGSPFRAAAAASGRLLDHPLYFRYNLMPLKTKRPYVEVVRDYVEVLDWFYDSRRLLGYCAGIGRALREGRSPRVGEHVLARLPVGLVLKLIAIYAWLCLSSRSWRGLAQIPRLAGRSKADIMDFLIIRGVALGAKGQMARLSRRVRTGMDELRAARLYPFHGGRRS